MKDISSQSFFAKMSIILIWAYVFFYILFLWKDLLIPLLLAFFLSAALIRTHHAFREKLKFPRIISFFATIILYIWILSLVAMIINNNVQSIISDSASYEAKIVAIINQWLWIIGLEQTFSFESVIKSINIQSLLWGIGWAMTWVLASMSTILIYTAFILAEYNFIWNKATTLFKLSPEGKTLKVIFHKIEEDIVSYFKIHNLFSLGTGMWTFIVCSVLWVEFAAFWGLLAFLLNYIPTIGSALAAIIPLCFSVIQFGAEGQWWVVAILAILLIALQFTMWNVIEPKFLWNKLNLSPLVILLSLTFWGYIWWVTGMFLSIPLMVMVNIACSHFDSTKWIHVILSQKGKLIIKK